MGEGEGGGGSTTVSTRWCYFCTHSLGVGMDACGGGRVRGGGVGWYYCEYQVMLLLYSLSGCRDGCMWGRERGVYSLSRVEAVLLLTPMM